MENLNAEQIIKMLECCASSNGLSACESGCPLWEQEPCPCIDEPEAVLNYTLSLIKKLTEANEHLRERLLESEERIENEKKSAYEGLSLYLLKSEALAAENKELQASCEELKKFCNIFKKRVDTVKSDTVREMQERINAHFDSDSDYFRNSHGYIRSVIALIAKEVLEGKKYDSGN